MESLPNVNLFYVFPLLKQLYDNLSVYINKIPPSEVLQVRASYPLLKLATLILMDFRSSIAFIGWRYFKTFAVNQLTEISAMVYLLQCGASGMIIQLSILLSQ